jgi:hypothetical protein
MSAKATKPARRDAWVCAECNKAYVVPSLARDCERKHLN